MVIVPVTTNNSVRERSFVTGLCSRPWVDGFPSHIFQAAPQIIPWMLWLSAIQIFSDTCMSKIPSSPWCLLYSLFPLSISIYEYIPQPSTSQTVCSSQQNFPGWAMWVPQLRPLLCRHSTLCWITSCSTLLLPSSLHTTVIVLVWTPFEANKLLSIFLSLL